MVPGKILIVEDEKENREILTLHLERTGYQVLEAEDGQRAKEVLQEGNNRTTVDVIITDIRMPKANGLEIIDYFKKYAPDISVIVVTGFPDNKLSEQLVKKGVKKFLVKPVEKKTLLQTVAELLA